MTLKSTTTSNLPTNLAWLALAICVALIVCSGIVEALPSIPTEFDIGALAKLAATIPVIGAPGAKGANGAKGAWSIPEWCAYRGYSVATFYKMKKNGTAPFITYLPCASARITVESDSKWLEFCQNLPAEIVAQIEARSAERRDRARKAGEAGVTSPLHPHPKTGVRVAAAAKRKVPA